MEGALHHGADPGLRLIETLGWDGARFVRRDLHLARLAASAARLGWACAPAVLPAAAAALQATADAVAAPARVRLTVAADGGVDVTTAPMPAPEPVWRLALATERLASCDPWLSVKSTRRPAYDAARAALPAGIDEVILLNERGEVCDGSITTLFFDRGHGLRTPPLSSGVLPGVLRTELAPAQEVLMADDLPRVRLWVGNSLRGLIAGVWTG